MPPSPAAAIDARVWPAYTPRLTLAPQPGPPLRPVSPVGKAQNFRERPLPASWVYFHAAYDPALVKTLKPIGMQMISFLLITCLNECVLKSLMFASVSLETPLKKGQGTQVSMNQVSGKSLHGAV